MVGVVGPVARVLRSAVRIGLEGGRVWPHERERARRVGDRGLIGRKKLGVETNCIAKRRADDDAYGTVM